MKRTLPDGFAGAVMAVDSITDAVAFLHGPGGCRVRPMLLSSAFPRMTLEEGEGGYMPYFFGYPRVPATFLDEYDYINGANYKMKEGLPIVNMKKPNLTVILNSPGAGLIGDNHEKSIKETGLEGKVIWMDEAFASAPMAAGYDRTLTEIMKHLDPERTGVEENTVIILGMTIMDKAWDTAVDELTENLEAMGLRVICTPGTKATTSELADSVNAEYAVIVCPEACDSLAGYYGSKGVKVIRSPHGAPVGFDATESWYKAVAEATGKDASIPLARIAKTKKYVYNRFVGVKYDALRIRGLTFSAAGLGSVIRPLTEWLYRYLAIAPVAVDVDPGSDPQNVKELKEFLGSANYPESFGIEPKKGSSIVLCEGITASTMKLNGECDIGIPIGCSSLGLDDVIPRPVYGIYGALYILDEILHGMRDG